MHLKVSDQPYTSRSCTASPTHHLGSGPAFPGTQTNAAGSKTNQPSSSSPFHSPTKIHRHKSHRETSGGSPSHHPPTRPRDRTNSLTVESITQQHLRQSHLLNHHHRTHRRHPPLQHHPTLK